MQRCEWAGTDPDYVRYHDEEWGRPVTDETRLFEKLCLEGFQSGLSWLTILRKRERFRMQFYDFNVDRVAAMDDDDVTRLLGDPGIIRHRGKIESTINNAKAAQRVRTEFGSLATFIWAYEPPPASPPGVRTEFVAQTEASRALSKDLKKRGFSFVGPTTVYAFMQAMGLVNDHHVDCQCRQSCLDLRARLRVPASETENTPGPTGRG